MNRGLKKITGWMLLFFLLCLLNGAEAEATSDFSQTILAPEPAYTLNGGYRANDGTIWMNEYTVIKIMAPDGYTISTIPDGTFGDSLDISADSIPDSIYLKRSSDGAVSSALSITETIGKDSTAPAGAITLSKNNTFFTDLTSVFTFSTFFKDDITVTVSASDSPDGDAGSGVGSIEYYVSNSEEVVDVQTITSWQRFSEPFSLSDVGKTVVYARITDNVGNVTYINTDGFVLYTDSVIDTPYAVYTKGSNQDVQMGISLHGNTVKQIKINEEILTSDNYTIDTDGTLTLDASYLETLKVGDYTAEISYHPYGLDFVSGDKPADTAFDLTVEADTSAWGQEIIENDITFYVHADGTTSTKVAGADVTWLKEEVSGQSAWFALDNSSGTFETGSRFWVRWLTSESHTKEWNHYYSQMDENHREAIEDNHLSLFLIGVTNPDGHAYTDAVPAVNVYMQLADDWDQADLRGIHISSGSDENIFTSANDMMYPAGDDTFAKLTLNHFSPYAVYDARSKEEQEALNQNNSSQDHSGSRQEENSSDNGVRGQKLKYVPATGDPAKPVLWLVAIVSAQMLMFVLKRKYPT